MPTALDQEPFGGQALNGGAQINPADRPAGAFAFFSVKADDDGGPVGPLFEAAGNNAEEAFSNAYC